jgi:hypothetical protein
MTRWSTDDFARLKRLKVVELRAELVEGGVDATGWTKQATVTQRQAEEAQAVQEISDGLDSVPSLTDNKNGKEMSKDNSFNKNNKKKKRRKKRQVEVRVLEEPSNDV